MLNAIMTICNVHEEIHKKLEKVLAIDYQSAKEFSENPRNMSKKPMLLI